MARKTIDYDSVLAKYKFTPETAANNLEQCLMRQEPPAYGALARAIVTLRSSEKWISVKDRYPKNNKPCIVWVYDSFAKGYFYQLSSYNGFEWLNTNGNKVTHWMPFELPVPPEEDLT